MGTERTRRGFFGWLCGLAALPLMWRRYPPVIAVRLFDEFPPRALAQGAVIQFYAQDKAGRATNGTAYWVRVGQWDLKNRLIYREPSPLVEFDHRPTWAEVREIVKYPPVHDVPIYGKLPPVPPGTVAQFVCSGRPVNPQLYYIRRGGECSGFTRLDHRPTWADVRDVLAKHRG
jgi:hypothetical protein